MNGSVVNNIRFDPTKQKLVKCAGCQREIIVKKFSGNDQRCDNCTNLNKKSTSKLAIKKPAPQITVKSPTNLVSELVTNPGTFANKFIERVNELEFEFAPSQNAWRKNYPLDGGGRGTIYVYLKHGVAGSNAELDYFCYIEQRAINLSDDFFNKMSQEPATDCQMLVDEFSTVVSKESRMDHRKCDKCGMSTYGFIVHNKSGKILCFGVNTNNCGKKMFNNLGAEAEL